jgi:mono/diheme cytochrome c family protein
MMKRLLVCHSWRTHLRAEIALAWVLACPVAAQSSDAPTTAGISFFESKVRPILAERCYRCHGPESGKGKAGLRVDSPDALMRGGDSGPAIVRGEPEKSLLILAVRHDGAVSMPPKSKLAQPEIDALAAWVKLGAPWPDYAGGPAPVSSPGDSRRWDDKVRAFWAFQTLKVPAPPAVTDATWPLSAIDRFVLARLDSAGLRPAPPANKRTLIRRASLDLWGIPPSPEEIDAFMRDSSDQAFERPDDELEARIASFELAFRLQSEAPEMQNIAGESPATTRLYGLDDPATAGFGTQCLLARRFSERGVRFVQCNIGGWDAHNHLKVDHGNLARAIDKPIAGLFADLKGRGLWDDTLVVWGGEFGRTPTCEGADGRDHNPHGYTMWLAGGGVKSGLTWGKTDDYGYFAVDDKVHVHDLHATILHLLGLDHKRLTFRYVGRDFRLTDGHGEPVKGILS